VRASSLFLRLLWAAGFAGSVAVHDTPFCEVVGRHFEFDSIAEQNLDTVAAQAASQVGKHVVAVFKLYGKSRTGEDLSNGSEDLKRCFFDRFG
jgi:hypothetical protein